MDLSDRARRFAALGDPLRLAIVDHLLTTDCSPRDLCLRHGVPSNLLNHHLDILETSGIIRRTRSSGDRRLRYVSLVPDALPCVQSSRGNRYRRPLFVCTQNSARSQLAAALWLSVTGSRAGSAGTHPAERVNAKAVAAARRAGLDISGQVPRLIDESDADADVVITVCDRANEELADVGNRIHWSVSDPVEAGTVRAFDAVMTDLETRIRRLVYNATTEEGEQP